MSSPELALSDSTMGYAVSGNVPRFVYDQIYSNHPYNLFHGDVIRSSEENELYSCFVLIGK